MFTPNLLHNKTKANLFVELTLILFSIYYTIYLLYNKNKTNLFDELTLIQFSRMETSLRSAID